MHNNKTVQTLRYSSIGNHKGEHMKHTYTSSTYSIPLYPICHSSFSGLLAPSVRLLVDARVVFVDFFAVFFCNAKTNTNILQLFQSQRAQLSNEISSRKSSHNIKINWINDSLHVLLNLHWRCTIM